MPSAEDTTYLIEVMPDTTQNFLSRDVDLLVSQIKENLRLSGFKAKSSVNHKSRPSPYRIPSRSWADPASCEICCGSALRNNGQGHHQHDHRHHINLNYHQKRTSSREEDQDDPYELLQELLRDGGLIKEAVKRLRANLEELENAEDSAYQRKPYFYDSEDEPRPPIFPPIEL